MYADDLACKQPKGIMCLMVGWHTELSKHRNVRRCYDGNSIFSQLIIFDGYVGQFQISFFQQRVKKNGFQCIAKSLIYDYCSPI